MADEKKNTSLRTGVRSRAKKPVVATDEGNDTTIPDETARPVPKKRGRKPKGGKIVDISDTNEPVEIIKPNVILHLKCSTTDLENADVRESDFSKVEISSYDANDHEYRFIDATNSDGSVREHTETSPSTVPPSSITEIMFGKNDMPSIADIECAQHVGYENTGENQPSRISGGAKRQIKELSKKLKTLEHMLRINSVPDTNAACFWCTYDFENPPVYIPKMFLKGAYHVYGCFCSPECAVAHLMSENIDSSCKFDRYSWLNSIYNSVYGYTKNIKPAPDPHYMLDRFLGNLTIQEYRDLLSSDRLFLVVDKPLTRILPELHEDNDEFIINNKIIPTATNYQVKRKTKPSQSVPNTPDNFGIFSVVE